MSTAAQPVAAQAPPRRIPSWVPLLLMALLMVGVGAYTYSRSAAFISEYNLRSLLLSALPLAFVAIAQANALLVGGFDVSVGAVMALVVMVGSFILTSSRSAPVALVAALALLGIGIGAGLANATLHSRLPPPVDHCDARHVERDARHHTDASGRPGGEINANPHHRAHEECRARPDLVHRRRRRCDRRDTWLYLTSERPASRAVGLDENAARRLGMRSTWVYVRAFMISGLWPR